MSGVTVMDGDDAFEAIIAGETLPDGLTVKGWLDLEGLDITSLPENLTIERFLDLEDCNTLNNLPNRLDVGEWVDVQGCNNLNNLPDQIHIGTGLFLNKVFVHHDSVFIESPYQPDTVLAVMQGRKLSEVFSHPLLHGRPLMDMVITSAEYSHPEYTVRGAPHTSVSVVTHATGGIILYTDGNPLEHLSLRPAPSQEPA